MKNDIVNELKSTKIELLETLGRLSDGNINTIPFEGSWTGGQVAEHVLMSSSAVAGALSSPAETAERDSNQHIELFSQVFLNFDHKLKSPDFILPSDKPKDKQSLIQSLKETFEKIEQAAGSGDLDLICTSFDMPTIGKLSRRELTWFTIVHTKRHIHQLKNIADLLEKVHTNETIN
jgi:hypothetical protein